MEIYPWTLSIQDTEYVLQSLPQDKTKLKAEAVDSRGRVVPSPKG